MAKRYQGGNQNMYMSVLLWYTDSDYTLDIFWPLCCLFLYNIQILFTPLVSFDHCGVCSSMIYIFWLPPWYLLAIVFIEEQTTQWTNDYKLGIICPLCCLFLYDIQILITALVSFGHCHRRTENTMAKRYQGCNQNLYIIEEQTTQWPKDNKSVIRFCIS